MCIRDSFKARNGTPLVVDKDGATLGADIGAGVIFVDGVDIGDPDDIALRDRRALSADGLFIVVATVSREHGDPVSDPEVIFRGVPFLDEQETEALIEDIRDVVDESLEKHHDTDREIALIQQDLHDDVAAWVYDRLKRRPMVLPVVVEV